MAITTRQAVIEKPASLDTQKFNTADHQITLVFGSRYTFEDENVIQKLLPPSPDHHVIMCSTSGQIADTFVYDDELVLTGISFEHTKTQIAKTNITNSEDSYNIGKQLAGELPSENLVHVLIFSDGHTANGSELIKGFNDTLKENVKITGGMAGDAARFQILLVRIEKLPNLKAMCSMNWTVKMPWICTKITWEIWLPSCPVLPCFSRFPLPFPVVMSHWCVLYSP